LPANAIECHLENIYTQLQKFKENPSYENKEVLLSLVSNHDLNQSSSLGLHRTTEYEISLINSLFINALKSYLYEIVGQKTRIQKIVSWFEDIDKSIEIKEFMGLIPQLNLYHMAYQSFTVDKDSTFSEKIIETVEESLDYFKENDSEEVYEEKLALMTNQYISLTNGI